MLRLLLTTAVVIVAVTADGVAMPTLRHKASQKTCVQGRPYELNYDVTLIDSTFLDLDDPHTGLKDVECDLDQTRLRLIFKDSGKLLDFEKKLVGGVFKSFLTSKFNWPSCPRNVTGNNQALIRRVTSWLPELYEHKLKMQATASRYDEVMQDGTISFGAVQGTCEEEVDQPICIGLNVDDNCHQTAGPIPIYQNQFVDLECSNCFVGFGADVFVDVKLSGWELASLDAGFRNMTLDAATIFDLKATADWSTGVDKTYPIVPQTTLIDFKVGPLPFRFTFEVPLRITADASFHADAEAIAGATANISLGELAVHWDPTNHWSHNVPKPVMSWAPYIAGTEPEFNAEASLAVIPSATMKLNDILTYSLTAQPQLDLKLYGSVASKQICSNTTADLTLSAHTELHIDIDWLHVHTDKEWDKTFYDSGIVHLEDKCVPI